MTFMSIYFPNNQYFFENFTLVIQLNHSIIIIYTLEMIIKRLNSLQKLTYYP